MIQSLQLVTYCLLLHETEALFFSFPPLQLFQTSLGPWLEKCQKMFLACMRIMRFAQSDQAMDGEEEAPGPTFCDSGPREGRGGK